MYLSVRTIAYNHSDCLQRHLFVSDDTSLLDTGQTENPAFTPDTGQPKKATRSVSFRNDYKDGSSGKSNICFVPLKEKEIMKPLNDAPEHPDVSVDTKEDKEPSLPFSPAKKDKFATFKPNETEDQRLNNRKDIPDAKQPGAINESRDKQFDQKPENSEDHLILDKKLRCKDQNTELISKGTSHDQCSSNKNPSPNGERKKHSLLKSGTTASAKELIKDNQISSHRPHDQLTSRSSPSISIGKKDDNEPNITKSSLESKGDFTHQMSHEPLVTSVSQTSLGSKSQDKLNPRSPTRKKTKKTSKTQNDGSQEWTPNDFGEVKNTCSQSKGSEPNENLRQRSNPQINPMTENALRGKVEEGENSSISNDKREVEEAGPEVSNEGKEPIHAQISGQKLFDYKVGTSPGKVDGDKDKTRAENADISLESSCNSREEFGQHPTLKSSDCLVEESIDETPTRVRSLGNDSNQDTESEDSKTYQEKQRHEDIEKQTKSSSSLQTKANRLPSDSRKPKIRGKKTKIISDTENIEGVTMVSNQKPKEISSDMLKNKSVKLGNMKTTQKSKKAGSTPTLPDQNDSNDAICKPLSVGKSSQKPKKDSSNPSKKKAENPTTDKLGPQCPLPKQTKTTETPGIIKAETEASQESILVREPVCDLQADGDNKKKASQENHETQVKPTSVKGLPDKSPDPCASKIMNPKIVDKVPDSKKIVSKKTTPIRLLKKAESPEQTNPTSTNMINHSDMLDPKSSPPSPKRKNSPIQSLAKDERCSEPKRENTKSVEESEQSLPNLATLQDSLDAVLDSQTFKEETTAVAPKSDSRVKSRKPNLVKERVKSPSKKVSFQNPLGEIKTIETIESAEENQNVNDEVVTESTDANIVIPSRHNLTKRSSPTQQRRVPRTKNRSSPSLKLPKKIKSICDDLTSNTDYKRRRPRSCSGDVADGSPTRSCSGDVADGSPTRSCSGDVADGSPTRSCSGDVADGSPTRSCSGDVADGSPKRSSGGDVADCPPSGLVSGDSNDRGKCKPENNSHYQSMPVDDEEISLVSTTENDNHKDVEQKLNPPVENPSTNPSSAKIDAGIHAPVEDLDTEYSECEFDLHESILELQDITDAEVRLLADMTPDPDREIGGTEDLTPIKHVKTPSESETSCTDDDVPFTIPEKRCGHAYSTLRVSLLEEESIQLKMNRMTISGSEFIKSIEELSEEIQTTIRRSSASPRIFREDHNFPLSPIPDRSKSYSPPKDHNILTVNYCFSPDNLTSIMSRSLEEFSFMEQLSILQNKDERNSEKSLTEKKATRETKRDCDNENVASRTSAEGDTEMNEPIDSRTPSNINVNSKNIGRIKKQAVSRLDTRSNTTTLRKVPKRRGSPISGMKKNRPKSPAGSKARSNNALSFKSLNGEKKKITENSSKMSLLKRSVKSTSQSKGAAGNSSQGQSLKDTKPKSSTVIKKSSLHARTSTNNSNESKSLRMKPTFQSVSKPQPARSEASSSANTTISNSRHERIQRKAKLTSTPGIKKSPSNASISSKGSDGSDAKSPNLLRLRPNPVRSESQSSLNSLTSLRSNASSRNGRTSELRRTALIRSQSNSSMSSIGSNSKKIKDIKRQARSKIDTGLQRKTKIPSSSQGSSPVSFTDGKSSTIVDPDIIATDSLFTYDESTMNNSEVSCPTPNPLSTELEEEQ